MRLSALLISISWMTVANAGRYVMVSKLSELGLPYKLGILTVSASNPISNLCNK